MKVHGGERLEDAKQKHAALRKPLKAWRVKADAAQWKTFQDVKADFCSADVLSDNRVVFDIKGNDFRLLAKIAYQNGVLVVQWIGTHAEYSKLSL